MKEAISTAVACLVVLLAIGIFVPAATAAGTTVYIDPGTTVTSGQQETFWIMIDTDDAAGIGSATMTVTYDPTVLQLDDVSNGDLGTVTANDDNGVITMTATDAQACPTGAGIKFADLTFSPVGNAGECSDLDLEVTSLYNCDVQKITPDPVGDGEFCIPGTPTATTVYVDPGTTVTSGQQETFWIMIDTDDAAGIGSAAMTVTYDPTVLQLDDVSNGDLGTVTANDDNGVITMTATDAQACPTGAGIKFADLKFSPVGNAGECSDLDLEVTSLYNCDVQKITPDPVGDGEFCIPGTPTATTVYVDPGTTVTSGQQETFWIMIDTDDAAGIGSATMTVTYDPTVLQLDDVSNGDLGTVTANDDNGVITMTATDAQACPTGAGIKFADLTFSPVGNAGECSDLDLEVTSLYNCDVQKITPDPVGDGEFCVEVPNDPPTVTVTYPIDDTVRGTITVTADAADTDGTVEQVEFRLMPGNTLIGTDVHSATTGEWSVSLNTIGLADVTGYQIKAIATDNGSATNEDTGGAFEIDNSCQCDFCLDLVAGWNFVSIPQYADADTTAVTFFNLSVGETVCYYDCAADAWLSNGDIDTQDDGILPCRGYWVYKLTDDRLCIDFCSGPGGDDCESATAPPENELCEGWNLIGHPYTDPLFIDDGSITDFGSITTLEGKFAQLVTWTPDGGWETYPLDAGFTTTNPGYAYWILMTEPATMYGTL